MPIINNQWLSRKALALRAKVPTWLNTNLRCGGLKPIPNTLIEHRPHHPWHYSKSILKPKIPRNPKTHWLTEGLATSLERYFSSTNDILGLRACEQTSSKLRAHISLHCCCYPFIVFSKKRHSEVSLCPMGMKASKARNGKSLDDKGHWQIERPRPKTLWLQSGYHINSTPTHTVHTWMVHGRGRVCESWVFSIPSTMSCCHECTYHLV